jgi:hypothetical protein
MAGLVFGGQVSRTAKSFKKSKCRLTSLSHQARRRQEARRRNDCKAHFPVIRLSMTQFERFCEYFKTFSGWLSAVPTVVTLLDAAKGWLPISTAIKPWAYILIVLSTFFSIWWEVGKPRGTPLRAKERTDMRRTAFYHMAGAVLLIGAYWILGETLASFIPTRAVYRTGLLFVLALFLGLVFSELSRAFAILALASN